MTPLHLACWYGHFDVVQYLLTSHDANLEATDSDGWTPLHFACDEGGHLDVVQELIARGADLFVANDDGCTPLHYAEEQGNERVHQGGGGGTDSSLGK